MKHLNIKIKHDDGTLVKAKCWIKEKEVELEYKHDKMTYGLTIQLSGHVYAKNVTHSSKSPTFVKHEAQSVTYITLDQLIGR